MLWILNAACMIGFTLMRKAGLGKHLMPHQISIAIVVGYGALLSLAADDVAIRPIATKLGAGKPNHATFVYFPILAGYFLSLVARKETNDNYAMFFPLLLAQALCLSLTVHEASTDELDPLSFDNLPTLISSIALLVAGRSVFGGFRARPGVMCGIAGALGIFVYLIMCFFEDSRAMVGSLFQLAEIAALLCVKIILDPTAGLPSHAAAEPSGPNKWVW